MCEHAFALEPAQLEICTTRYDEAGIRPESPAALRIRRPRRFSLQLARWCAQERVLRLRCCVRLLDSPAANAVRGQDEHAIASARVDAALFLDSADTQVRFTLNLISQCEHEVRRFAAAHPPRALRTE